MKKLIQIIACPLLACLMLFGMTSSAFADALDDDLDEVWTTQDIPAQRPSSKDISKAYSVPIYISSFSIGWLCASKPPFDSIMPPHNGSCHALYRSA